MNEQELLEHQKREAKESLHQIYVLFKSMVILFLISFIFVLIISIL